MTTRPHLAVRFRSGLALVVEADASQPDGDGVVLLRDGVVVYRLLSGTGAEVVLCGSQRDAEQRCKQWREAGASGIRVSEQGASRRVRGDASGRVVPLEGVAIRVRE
jgi:hypothetical protein